MYTCVYIYSIYKYIYVYLFRTSGGGRQLRAFSQKTNQKTRQLKQTNKHTQDMINNVGHRARSNAIAQHKLKMQLLAQQKVDLKNEESKVDLKDEESKDEESKVEKHKAGKPLDITSETDVDGEMHKLMKTGGRAAVKKQVDALREEILADAGKLTKYGKKAGFLPAPPGMSKSTAHKKLAAHKAALKKMARAI